MGRKRHTAEEVVNKLRQANVELAKVALIRRAPCALFPVNQIGANRNAAQPRSIRKQRMRS